MDARNLETGEAVARSWYLLQCKPRECERALEHLGNQGYEAYLPRRLREVVRRGRREVVSEPLFPHYLFVRLSDVADNWAPIRSTRGAVGLVRFGALPLPVPASVIESLRQREVAPEAEAVEELFVPGEPVEIIAGPLAGLEAVLAIRDGAQRAILLIRLLHQQQQVSVPLAQIRKREG